MRRMGCSRYSISLYRLSHSRLPSLSSQQRLKASFTARIDVQPVFFQPSTADDALSAMEKLDDLQRGNFVRVGPSWAEDSQQILKPPQCSRKMTHVWTFATLK